MEISNIIALSAIIIGGLGWIAMENGFKLKITYLSDLSDIEVNNLISLVLNLSAKREGVTTPKFKITDLSKHSNKKQNEHVLGLYTFHNKMIFIDVNRFIHRDADVNDIVKTIVHEFQHYVDDLNGLNEQNTVVELLEMRAEKAEKKYTNQIIKKIYKLAKKDSFHFLKKYI